MHRNTYLLLAVLAVFAALVVGVNVGKTLKNPTHTSPAIPTPTPARITQTYISTYCGFSLEYPSVYTVMDNASGSAIFTNPGDKNQSIAIVCQKDIPKPALPLDKMEAFAIGTSSLSATLYHDSAPRDGTPIDALIFRNPQGLDVFIAGYGQGYTSAIHSIQLLP